MEKISESVKGRTKRKLLNTQTTRGPNRIPWFPEEGIRVVREGLLSSRLYEADGCYFIDIQNTEDGKLRRTRYLSFYDAAQAFVRLQENVGGYR